MGPNRFPVRTNEHRAGDSGDGVCKVQCPLPTRMRQAPGALGGGIPPVAHEAQGAGHSRIVVRIIGAPGWLKTK
jgi:hypothetical protein